LGALRPELERRPESRFPDELWLEFSEVVSLDVSSDADFLVDDLLVPASPVLLFFTGRVRLADSLVPDDRDVFLAITAPFWGGLVQPSVAPRARPPT